MRSHGRHPLVASATVCVLLALSGCTSFAALEANDPGVDEEEVFAAGRAGDTEHLANLHHVLSHRSAYEPEVVAAALTSVGEIGAPSSVPHVAALQDDPSEEVRWHVAAALRRLGGDEARAVLARMAASDRSELVRDEAAAAGER